MLSLAPTNFILGKDVLDYFDGFNVYCTMYCTCTCTHVSVLSMYMYTCQCTCTCVCV